MPISNDSISGNARAMDLVATSEELQKMLVGALWSADTSVTQTVVRQLVDYAKLISNDRKCAVGEIIWGRAKPFEPTIAVLAAIRVLGDRAQKSEDHSALMSVMILQAMTILIHAESIADDEHVKTKVMIAKHAFGTIIDDLMKAANVTQR